MNSFVDPEARVPSLEDYVALKRKIRELSVDLREMEEEVFAQLQAAGGRADCSGCRCSTAWKRHFEYSPTLTAAIAGVRTLKHEERKDNTAKLIYETPYILVRSLKVKAE
jgi:hypothetical protein